MGSNGPQVVLNAATLVFFCFTVMICFGIVMFLIYGEPCYPKRKYEFDGSMKSAYGVDEIKITGTSTSFFF